MVFEAQRAAEETFEKRGSAGVNPAHRSAVLAMHPGKPGGVVACGWWLVGETGTSDAQIGSCVDDFAAHFLTNVLSSPLVV